MVKVRKAILIPFRDGKVLLQDRTGHKPPPWGFFGGSIEEGETVMQGLLRETKEELSISLQESDVKLLKEYDSDEQRRIMYVYLWKVNVNDSDFNLQEGKAMKYVDLNEAQSLLTDPMDLIVIKDAFSGIDGSNFVH